MELTVNDTKLTQEESQRLQGMTLSEPLVNLIRLIQNAGGNARLVGGAIRNTLLGLAVNDHDIEVFGLDPNQTFDLLVANGLDARWQGKNFGVIVATLSDGEDYELASPRRERKNGVGHNQYDIDVDPLMSTEEAAARRDFTVNAMAFDPLTGVLFDPAGGLEDLRNGVLRHVSDRFSEDPVRVLKGARHAAELGFELHESTAELCQNISHLFEHITVERTAKEWGKIVLSPKPSNAIDFLLQADWLKHFPELNDLAGVEQNPIYHPEGDARIHTGLVADAAATIAKNCDMNDTDTAVLVWAAICHDFGKKLTTVFEDDAWRSPGHAHAGVPLAEAFLTRLMVNQDVIAKVLPLVEFHMSHLDFKGHKVMRRDVQTMAQNLWPANHIFLKLICDADHLGRGRESRLSLTTHALFEEAQRANVLEGPPKALLNGFDVAAYFDGVMGKHIGETLKEAYKAQLLDKFREREEALKWLDSNMRVKLSVLKGDFVRDQVCGGVAGPKIREVLDAVWQAQRTGAVKTLDEAQTFALSFKE